MKSMGFILIILLYLLGNFYVFHHLWVAMPPNLLGRIIIIVFAVIAVGSFFLTFLLGEHMPVGLTSFFYKIGTSWLFIMLFFVIVMLVKDIVVLANKLIHFMPPNALTQYTTDNWMGLGFMVGFITLLMFCGYLKYTWKVKVDIPLQTEKKLGEHESLRIVALSDLHLGYNIGPKELDSWVDSINSLNPDLILIAGDIIDSSVRPLNMADMAPHLARLHAPMGVYTCPGNHEYLSGMSESMEFINRTGIRLLRDQSVEIDSTLCIIGRDDRSNPNRKSLDSLMVGIDTSRFTILLDHQPYNLEQTEKAGVDLQISGHTHQGQVWPISMITNAIYELDHGHIKKGNSDIIVSSGIGIWGGKFRIGTQSEYIVIDLKSTR